MARSVTGMNAVVLAGGPPDAVAALEPGAANKAFVPIAGTTLVERALRALRDVPRIARIIVVAPLAALDHPALALADERRPDGPHMIESLMNGVAGFSPDEPILVAASDLPMLTRIALDEVIDAVIARDLDVAYSCLERRYNDAAFPQVPHTWARLRDGQFCGAGVCAIKPRALPQLAQLLGALGAARKSPPRLAAIFGWDIVPSFLFGRLTIAAAEARATRLLGAPAGAIQCTHPEIAINVDRVTDVALVERLLQS
jgi:GTP:adenosylcobinamide-phosphate guanylyltransferase